MKKLISFFVLVSFLILMAGCYSQKFVVGEGAKGNQVVSERQWYILWGLVPLNTVDVQKMAAGATNYTIVTEHTFVDQLIAAFTGIVTVSPKTVEVRK